MNKKEATMAIPMALLKSKQKVVNNKRKLCLIRHAAINSHHHDLQKS